MELKKDSYIISKSTLEKVLNALSNNWFTTSADSDGYTEDFNNDDVIEADELLKAEVEKQQ